MRFGDLDISVDVDEGRRAVVRIAPRHEWDVGQQQAAEYLAQVLAPNVYWTEGAVAGITYDEDFDRHIIALIDLLAAIRCSVPHMVQLELELDDSTQLGRRLQVTLPGMAE